MESNRHLAWPAYAVAVMLIVIPIVDATIALMPMHVTASHWRFGAAGIAANAAMIPMSGLLIAFATAYALGHRRLLRAIAVASAIGTVATVLGLILFTLEVLQAKMLIRPEYTLTFELAASTATLKMVLAGVAFTGFAVGGWRVSKPAVEPKDTAATGATIVIRTSSATPAIAEGDEGPA